MINNLAVLLTCGGLLLVALRAVILDARNPWFNPIEEASEPQDTAKLVQGGPVAPWRRTQDRQAAGASVRQERLK